MGLSGVRKISLPGGFGAANAPGLEEIYAPYTAIQDLLGISHLFVVLLGFWLLINSSANTFIAVNTVLQQANGVVFVPVMFILKRTVRRAPEIERRILATAAAAA